MYTSIPNLHVSSKSKAKGSAKVRILSRIPVGHIGEFEVKIDVRFDPLLDNYPTGSLSIKTGLNDGLNGTFTATTVELMNSYGKENPTIYLVGRCSFDGTANPKGCKYWLMIADNKRNTVPLATADIIGFVIIDNKGDRVAYGTGPVVSGDIDVDPM